MYVLHSVRKLDTVFGHYDVIGELEKTNDNSSSNKTFYTLS
ncbi:hypothetical protein AB5I83_11175 [Mesobacillus sp. LC4]